MMSWATRHTIPLAIFVALIADQSSKFWLLYHYDIASKSPVAFGPYFSLVMAWNRGVSFSMFSHSAAWMPWVLTALAIVISTLLLRLALKTPFTREKLAYGLVIGGAIGNAIDRVRFGAVADFFYVHVGSVGWPAFNIADSAICLGVGILLLGMIKKPSTP